MRLREIEDAVVEIVLQIILFPFYVGGVIGMLISLPTFFHQNYREGCIYLFGGLIAYSCARAITKLHDARGYVE